MIKFSIIITTYNRLPLLKRAIESALNQTIPCEVIVVDDGSTDGTQDYVNRLGNRVIYFRNLVNKGHSATVNTGVEIAQGDWIKLLDDDDYLAPNCLEEMAKAIAIHPEAVICSCQAIQVNKHGIEVTRTQCNPSEPLYYIPQEDIHYGMLFDQVPFGTPVQVAFQKEAFLLSGGWNPEFDSNNDDSYSWIVLAQYGDAIFMNKYLAYRTLWEGGCSGQLSLQDRLKTNILIKEKIYSLVSPKYALFLPKRETLIRYLQLHWFLVGLKNRCIFKAFQVADRALFSPQAWLFLIKILLSKKRHSKSSLSLQKRLAELNPSLETEQLALMKI
ncbi:MAG: glycosyltransferase family 2 protein [Chroococcales cyanobacterium]